MNQKYCIGLDVHKNQTTFAVKDFKGATLMEGKCATQYKDPSKNLSKYIEKSSVVMEACTSYYHLYENMKKNDIDVHVANVIQLRKCVGKNDKIDKLSDEIELVKKGVSTKKITLPSYCIHAPSLHPLGHTIFSKLTYPLDSQNLSNTLQSGLFASQ